MGSHQPDRHRRWWTPTRPAVAAGLAACAGLSLLLLPTPGTIDVERYWLPWIDLIASAGVRAAYGQSASDYPPLAFVILSGIRSAALLLGLDVLLTLKLTLWAFLAGSAFILYRATRDAGLTAGFYLSLVLGSVGLAYLDVLFVPTLVLSLWALHRQRFALGLFLYGVACLVKFQPLIIAPVVLLYLYRSGQLRIAVLWPTLALAGVTLIVAGGDVLLALSRAGDHRYLSGLGLNFGWVLGYLVSVLVLKRPAFDVSIVAAPPAVLLAMRLIFAGLYGWVLVRMPVRTFSDFLRAASVAYLTYFAFSPGVHENHLVVLVVLLAFLAGAGGHTREFAAAAVFANLNLVLFFGLDGRGGPSGPVMAPVYLVLAITLTGLAIRTLMMATGGRRPAEI